ncbi:MAG: hypothetical protein R3195_03480 [Gemmatimonadota bacterium]|nr:hypothetical protein [Gemmatimonadota bacterium]
MRRITCLTALTLVLSASAVVAQPTFTPSFNAPYRAFESHEFGGTFSFPDGGRDFAIEGQYRQGFGNWDLGVRAGVFDSEGSSEADTGGSSEFIMGVEGRVRVLDHERHDFPLDGAIVLGVGTAEFDAWTVPSAGLSLGRRVNVDDFSFVLYGQPTMFLFTNGDSDVEFGLGLGSDFKVGDAIDLRLSLGVFEGPEGLAVSVVWVR